MSNIKGFGDLASDEEDNDDKHNDYYAGGEKSGQLIRGAPEQDDDPEDRVESLFAKARRHGAVQGTASDLEGPSSSFRGLGRTVAGAESAQAQQSGPRNHVITFYRNNVFTVDDGPARRVDDPVNLPFMESIAKGECPQELEVGSKGQAVTVNLVRKEEDFVEEKPKVQAFTGVGRTLASSSSSAPAPRPSQAPVGNWEGVNESLPSTSIQLRLSDGSRLVARMNNHHTVSDIRKFIRTARPDLPESYTLLTGFPSKLVEDENLTLEAAGLLNAVIIQKL